MRHNLWECFFRHTLVLFPSARQAGGFFFQISLYNSCKFAIITLLSSYFLQGVFWNAVRRNPNKTESASRILRLRLVASSDIQRMFEKGFPLQCEAGNCEGTGQLPLLNI